MDTYQPETIEKKWQEVWEAERAFYAPNPEPGVEPERKFYMLEMLPYPSGTLHMGHVLNYTLGDVLTHFHRRHGLHVLRPMGWDSFGLPGLLPLLLDCFRLVRVHVCLRVQKSLSLREAHGKLRAALAAFASCARKGAPAASLSDCTKLKESSP